MALIDMNEVRRREQRALTPTLIPITITSVDDVKYVNEDNTMVLCDEITDMTVNGTLPIPDRQFSVPLRRDDGRLFFFPAEVIGGVFSVVINLPTTGQFTYSDVECNHDLPHKAFTVKTLKIVCLRAKGNSPS
jgi:hypothetical protein